MKDLGALHFFLGLEVWQESDGIFLGQGKYMEEILQRFGMMNFKSRTTPMVANLKLLNDTSSDRVDSTIYRQMIGSLMYLTNTRSDICFAVNTLSQVHGGTKESTLDCSKTCTKVFERDSGIWTEVHFRS